MPNTRLPASKSMPAVLGILFSLAFSGLAQADATLDKIQERHKVSIGVILSGPPFGTLHELHEKYKSAAPLAVTP